MDAALHALHRRVVRRDAAVAAHQLDLQVVERVDVGEAVLNGTGQRRVGRQALVIAGDEAERVAKRTKRLIEAGATHNINVAEIRLSGQMAISLLRRSLDAFARLDTVAAAEVVQEDRQIDEEFRGFVRKLISYMMEDPHTITTGLDKLTIAKAIERIGDHAKNIAEFVIYIAKGSDVRHLPHEDLVREANRT